MHQIIDAYRELGACWNKIKVVVFLAMLAVLLITGFSIFIFKEVYLECDGRNVTILTSRYTVAGAIQEAKIEVGSKDLVIPEVAQTLRRGTHIKVIRAEKIKIYDGNDTYNVIAPVTTVQKVLEQSGIKLGPNDKIESNIKESDHSLYIKIIRVKEKIVVEEQEVFSPVQEKFTDSMVQGKIKVLEDGKPGLKRLSYKITYENGREISRKIFDEKVIREPRPKVVAYGTKERAGTASRNADLREATRVIQVEASGYTYTGNPTCTGIYPSRGTVAVDPQVIPLGTKLYIEGYGYGVAQDTGGMIKGNSIDLFFESRAQALKWGRKSVKVYIMGK